MIAVASISRVPANSSSVSCQGWLSPFYSRLQNFAPASLLPYSEQE